MKTLGSLERRWLAALVVLAVLLGVKSFWLDSWRPAPGQEGWLVAAEQALDAEAPGWLSESGLVHVRVVDIREQSPPGETLKVTARSYLLGYLPFGDRKLTLPLPAALN